ncbi:MAG: fibronectin type III domain-containing protein [Caldilineaceae bacterium SB0665_bin_21]|nr:fibronectin type III domain-containing protein [Caldilineaceae bacterium SB0665_bin_21]
MVKDVIHQSHLWGMQYIVKYRQFSRDGSGDWTNSGSYWMESENRTDVVSGLSPNTRYEVKVVARVEHYNGDFPTFEFDSGITKGRTIPLPGDIVIRELNAENRGKRIRISWKRPLLAPALGIVGYAVQLVKQPIAQPRPSANASEWTNLCAAEGNICDASTRKKAVVGIEKDPQVEYFVRVAPVTVDGLGQWSYYPKSKRHGLVKE